MESEPFFEIEVPGRLPSWNDILGMEQWARYKFKKELADTFLSSLRQYAAGSSTTTTVAKSSMWIYADTLQLFLETAEKRRALRRANKKLKQMEENLFASQSSKLQPEV